MVDHCFISGNDVFRSLYHILYCHTKICSTQRLLDRLNLVARESLTGIMVVRAFNRQKFEENRFEKLNTDLSLVNLYINRVMAFLTPAIMLILNTNNDKQLFGLVLAKFIWTIPDR